jgi:ABC-type dipeptide/oligopeptide/nickel transport system permease subunit
MRADVALSPGSSELQAVHQRQVSRLGRLLTLIRHKPLGAISAFVICLLVLVAIFANQIAPYDPTATHPRDKLLGPSATYRLGTDDLGRDVFSRIVVGARTSLWAGIAATMFGTLLGSLIGMVSGYAGGALDMLIQRIMDSLQVLPLIVLLLVVVVALGPSLLNIIWALSIGILPAAGRIVRGATLVTKSESYVESARIVGAGPVRILIRHILPNVMAPIIVIASITIGGAIRAEASLSFLARGVPPPNPSWGGMLAASGRRYFERAPSLALFPGLAITITVLAFNLLGDTLRDLFDPRLRNR